MKNLAVDVHYQGGMATGAGVLFEDWGDARGEETYISKIEGVHDYIPGEFYKRELPCLLKLLEDHQITPGCIVVDGFVYLDGLGKAGLGKYLYDALGGKVGVIGVAKKFYNGIPRDFELYRGKSEKPLFVTSAGLDVDAAKRFIARMHGDFRIPTLLRIADRACRGGQDQPNRHNQPR